MCLWYWLSFYTEIARERRDTENAEILSWSNYAQGWQKGEARGLKPPQFAKVYLASRAPPQIDTVSNGISLKMIKYSDRMLISNILYRNRPTLSFLHVYG